ncbi:MAG: S8 family serine peptidase [Planctomycetes bacterium]|nr:S8 family serine peptidase [Planctomycetota bacterium]
MHRNILATILALCGTAAAVDNAGRAIVNPREGWLNLRTGDVDSSTLANLIGQATFKPGVYVLRLNGPMDDQRGAALGAAGVRLEGYLPTNFFLADLSGTAPGAVKAMGFVTGVYEYQRAWKVDQNLNLGANARPYQTNERINLAAAGQVAAKVWLFEGEVDGPARAALAGVPGLVIRGSETVGGAVGLTITAPGASIAAVADAPGVQFVEEYPEYAARSNALTRAVVQSGLPNVTPLYDRDLTGTGMVIGVIDGWIAASHCAFADGSVPIGPLHRKLLAYNTTQSYDAHGTHVACTAAGDAGTTGDLRGVAYNAKIVFNTWPDMTETSAFTKFNLHYSQGATVHTNSWGVDWMDAYDGACRAIDDLQFRFDDNLILHAVSNSSLVHNPENAKNSLAVAASNNYPSYDSMCYGGAGPTIDGRRKPEVTAPGCSITSAGGNGGCNVSIMSGTSMATPATAGVALLMRQYYTRGFYPGGAMNGADAFNPSGALVKATVIDSAQDMSGDPGYPGSREGWGRVLADAALYFSGDARKLRVADVRNGTTQALTTGGFCESTISVDSAAMPLRVTLVWHDAPAAVNASFAPVNNLDLVVTSPTGEVYRGNNFSGGFSAAGGTADIRNNTEQVHIAAPTPGLWQVRVVATAVNQGRQGFALVMTGAISDPPCVADFNGDGGVDGADVEAFFAVWGAGDSRADIDLNGGVDGADVAAFFDLWGAGC